MRSWALVIAAVGLACTLAIHGCGSDDSTPDCPALPETNACPVVGGGSCDDISCSAIYECTTSGTWSLVQRCDQDGGYVSTNGLDGGDESDGLDPSMCAAFSAPPAYPACDALEAPECDDAIEIACPVQACTSECMYYLKCGPNGWSERYTAYCDDMGTLIIPPPP